jgi:hypothetical protein
VQDAIELIDEVKALRGLVPVVTRICRQEVEEHVSERFLANQPIPSANKHCNMDDMIAAEGEFPLKISLCWKCPLRRPDESRQSWSPIYEEDSERTVVTGYNLYCLAKKENIYSYNLPPSECPWVTEHAVSTMTKEKA